MANQYKKISDFNNKPVPLGADLFLIEDGSTGIYYKVTRTQLLSIFGGPQALSQVLNNGNTTGGQTITSDDTNASLSVFDNLVKLIWTDGLGASAQFFGRAVGNLMSWTNGTVNARINQSATKTVYEHDVLNEFNAPENNVNGNFSATSSSGSFMYNNASSSGWDFVGGSNSGGINTIDSKNDIHHDVLNEFNAPNNNFPQETASKIAIFDSSKNLKSGTIDPSTLQVGTDIDEPFTVTGTTQVLGHTPTFVYGIYLNGQRLVNTIDYTISVATITFTNSLSSDSITAVYKY